MCLNVLANIIVDIFRVNNFGDMATLAVDEGVHRAVA
jgi:hypothetical protein